MNETIEIQRLTKAIANLANILVETTAAKVREQILTATVTAGQRSKILKLARGEEPQSTSAQNSNSHEPRIYSREETAKILGNRSLRYIDQLCRRGLLQKFIPKGNRRAIGIYSRSLRAFIAQ